MTLRTTVTATKDEIVTVNVNANDDPSGTHKKDAIITLNITTEGNHKYVSNSASPANVEHVAGTLSFTWKETWPVSFKKKDYSVQIECNSPGTKANAVGKVATSWKVGNVTFNEEDDDDDDYTCES